MMRYNIYFIRDRSTDAVKMRLSLRGYLMSGGGGRIMTNISNLSVCPKEASPDAGDSQVQHQQNMNDTGVDFDL